MFQNEDLLNEINQLKEEIKKKDEKIQLLEHQLVSIVVCKMKVFKLGNMYIFNKTSQN